MICLYIQFNYIEKPMQKQPMGTKCAIKYASICYPVAFFLLCFLSRNDIIGQINAEVNEKKSFKEETA